MGLEKKRISYTMSPEIQSFLDEMIRKKHFAGYQHAIDFCLTCLAEKKMLIVDDEFMQDFGRKLDEILELAKRQS